MEELAKDTPTMEREADCCVESEDDDQAEDNGDPSANLQEAVRNIIDFGKGVVSRVAAVAAEFAPKHIAGAPLPYGAEAAQSVQKDDAGRITSFKSEDGHSTEIKYDDKGRMTSSIARDSQGRLSGITTARYDDELGTRVTNEVNYDMDGSISSIYESRDSFQNGKLVSHSEKTMDTSLRMEFDAKGRETFSHEKAYDGSETETEREYLENGNVKVTSTSIKDGRSSGRTTAEFDKDGNRVGSEISQRLDQDGNEVARTETSTIPGGYSRKFFENGELTRQVDVTTQKGEKGAQHVTEKHYDAAGKLVKTVDADFFPRQPYLPTKITVTKPDGSVKESLEITYATNDKGRLSTAGPSALIKSISHLVPPAEATRKEYNTRREQLGAWSDVFKASKNLGTYNIQIGRPVPHQTYGPRIYEPIGTSAEDILHNGRSRGAA